VTVTFRGRAAVGLVVSLGVVILLWSGVLDSLGTTTRGLILVAAGVTLLGVVLPLQLRTRTLLKHGVRVQGTVVDAEEKTGRGSDNLPYRTYHPVVEFTTTDGRTVTFTSGLGFSVRQPRIGSAVPVRYRHDDPEQAEIDRAYLWMVPAAPPLLAGVGLLVAAGVAFTDEPRVAPAAEESQVAPTVVDSPDDSVTEEPVPTEPPPAKVATGRIGDRLTVTDRTGKAQLEITVTRVEFSGGLLSVHVEAHALADEQHLILAALVDGHYYDELVMGVSSAGFQPMLGLDELSLSRGERVAGWLELDVPSGHGRLVLRDETLQHKVAVWTY
jgi:Protein of unknown function (DUF3592)